MADDPKIHGPRMAMARPIALYVDPHAMRGTCGHMFVQFVIDKPAGIVRCGKCQSIVDPWLALTRLTDHWDRQSSACKALDRTIGQLEAQKDDLQREVKNLKARVRRAKKPGTG